MAARAGPRPAAPGEGGPSTSEVLRVGARARLDPDPEREVGPWRTEVERGEIDDPAETRARLGQYERGESAIVRLDLFADVAGGGGRLERFDSVRVEGLWFTVGRAEENLAHAREMVADNLHRLRDDLAEHGIDASLQALSEVPIRVELDEELERRFGPAT